MAAVAEMGEVDEMHSKDESSLLTNGDLSTDIDEENVDSDDVKKMSGPEAEEEEEDEEEEDDDDEEEEGTTFEAKERSEKEEVTPVEGTEENSVDEIKEDEDASQEEDKSEKDDDTDEVSSSSSSSEEDDKSDDECDKSEGKREEEEAEGEDVDTEEEKNDENVISKDVEIHEIDSEEEDEKEKEKTAINDELIELNDSGGEGDGDGDVMIVDSPKQNGGTEVIDLDETPEKSVAVSEVKETEQKKQIAPRRSSRNLNKSKSYAENDHEVVEKPRESEESDIEEVLPEDPLACNNSITVEKITIDKSKPSVTGNKQSTIVVKDTKRLVEIASKSSNNSSGQGKKEPTLVIIDTNSILSGKGPVPVNNNKGSVTNYSTVLPMALPAQGMYPPNMRATITPIPVNASSTTTPPAKTSPATITPAIGVPLLPSLTDDMFVVEAPSFIVPYVYEKPPSRTIGDFLKDLEKEKEKDEELKDKKEKDKGGSSKDKDVEKENDKSVDHQDDSKKSYSFFDSPLGKFFINIGFNLVQEHVQTDLLKQQKRKAYREGNSNTETEKSIHTLTKNLEFSKENNEPYRLDIKKCEFCTFRTESSLAMAYHLETPHMKAFVYRCNFCPFEVRSPHDILFHMEAEHAVRGHLERAPAFHQCPNCPFEDNQKGKLSRHLVACSRKFKPERNLEPPVDWEPPAKIPRVPKMRQQGLNATVTAYQSMAKTAQYQFLSKMQLQSTQQVLHRGRGRPTLGPNTTAPQNIQAVKTPQGTVLRPASATSMVFKQGTMAGGSVLVPASYQLSGNQVFQNLNQKKSNQQPSISITPLPRGTGAMSSTSSPVTSAKPGDTTSKNAFVICEICDGYIKDLEQLRNHMQWIHKIKIHPKMIYNRPPLNCQKCQFRFFTDQGLERHLLGSHGLVTSSMQDAANKSRDSGRCPVCGRVYQWKLLNHVARDHNMTLKPAHLSYKCTVCTATFGMYKQFENHVYSAHSVVAKRVMDKKTASAASSSPSSSTSLSSKSSADQLKPLKINDEITIIPQPTSTKATANATANGKEGSPGKSGAGKSR